MRRAWMACLAYSIITLALTHPLILRLGDVLPHDAGDPALNTWILWWNAHAIPYTSRWWNAPNFYPIPGALAFSENLLGLSLVASPIQWLGFNPQVAYNIVFLLTFPLSAIGAFLLARELVGRDDAAFLAGLLYGFAPYRIAHLPQIQALAGFAMPFALVGLHRYLREAQTKWLVLFGTCWFLQAICNGYYLLFFAVFTGLWMLWFASPWAKPRAFVALMATWIIASLPLLPLLWQYQVIHRGFGFTRDFGTIREFGADVAAFLNAASTLFFWGWLRVFRRAEGELFPGLTIVLLIVAGAIVLRDDLPTRSRRWIAVRRALMVLAAVTAIVSLSAIVIGPWRFSPFGVRLFSVSNPIKPLTFSLLIAIGLALSSPRLRHAYATRSVLGFYALTAFVMWLFSLGPAPSLMGKPFMYRAPYALLMILPGFSALRVPARFWMMTVLCLAVIGSIIFDRLMPKVGLNRLAVAGILALGILADGWVAPFPLVPAPPAWAAEQCIPPQVPRSSSGAVMELPLGEPFRDVGAMYRAMAHGRPLVNGYSGFFPPHYPALRFGLDLLEDDVLTQLANHGVEYIVINRNDDGDGIWRRYVSEHRGARQICAEEQQTVYRLTPTAESGATPTSSGSPIQVAAIHATVNEHAVTNMTDGDRTTRWESGVQRDNVEMQIDLGAVKSVDEVELRLGPFIEDFPRLMVIEASEDGQIWNERWRGGSAGLAFVGAFQDPANVPLTYRLDGTRARYLKLRLLANDDTYYWSVAEIMVRGS
jgi:hypothetical protein